MLNLSPYSQRNMKQDKCTKSGGMPIKKEEDILQASMNWKEKKVEGRRRVRSEREGEKGKREISLGQIQSFFFSPLLSR